MSEEKQLLITRIELGETEDGKPAVEMYEANPRLKYPSLRLFDLSELFVVGIDPNELQLGDERFTRFKAWYVESDRLNKEGNRYKDVTRLEKLEDKQDGSRDDLASIIALLQSIDRRLASIHQITEVVAARIMRQAEENANRMYEIDLPLNDDPDPGDNSDRAMYMHEDMPEEVPEPAPEEDSDPILSEDMARRRFGKLAGPAIRAGKLNSSIPGKLTSQVSAGAMNWRDALAALEAAIVEGNGS